MTTANVVQKAEDTLLNIILQRALNIDDRPSFSKKINKPEILLKQSLLEWKNAQLYDEAQHTCDKIEQK